MNASIKHSLGKKEGTQSALRASVFTAVRLIEARYDDPPSAKELAQVAGVCTSHFHHAFQEVVGESIVQHVLRLRVERAASLLKFSSWQVGEIALACGFQTQASFGRGFKRMYGMTPQQFRKSEGTIPFLRGRVRSRPNQSLEDVSLPSPTVRIENWTTLDAICLRFYGQVNEVHKPWTELLSWAKKELPDLEQARFFGLWFDDWSGKSDEHYRYDCAIVPASPVSPPPPEPFFVRSITAGEVAVAQAQGSVSALDRSWRAFGTGWFPHSGYQPRTDFVMDEYSSDLMLASPFRQLVQSKVGKISIKMCIPIQEGPVEY